MLKSERRKIALRNLRKAWAAKKGKRAKRKNPRSRKSLPQSTMLTRQRGFTAVRALCERHGPEIALRGIASWCLSNATALRNRGEMNEYAAYLALARHVFIVRIKAIGL